MPYIKQEQRDALDGEIFQPSSPGELNYVLTGKCLDYLSASERSYADYNEIIGVLECVKQEFYRRAVVPYEEKKKEENGDVFE